MGPFAREDVITLESVDVDERLTGDGMKKSTYVNSPPSPCVRER